jgi:hypothetical protein
MSYEFKYTAGFRNVGSYQISTEPWLSASITIPPNSGTPLEITFPRITKFIIIRNESGSTGDLRVGFSANGLKAGASGHDNYAILSGSESFSADYRVKSVFLLSHTTIQQTASVIAGLTPIPTSNFPLIGGTYDNWSGSSGVG